VFPIAAKILKQTTEQLHVYDTPSTNVKDFLKLRQVKDKDTKEDNNNDSDVNDNEDFEDNNPLISLVKNLFGRAQPWTAKMKKY
jgi:hypothetical protein